MPTKTSPFLFYEYASPIGALKIQISGHGIQKISFIRAEFPRPGRGNRAPTKNPPLSPFISAKGGSASGRKGGRKGDLKTKINCWLDAYFKGSNKPFPWELIDLPFGTSFQKKVWTQLWKIPYGKVISYKTLAQKVKLPKAARAVGNANGKNPLPIIIPCHRVIAANGGIGGYSCGVGIKKKLLAIENIKVG